METAVDIIPHVAPTLFTHSKEIVDNFYYDRAMKRIAIFKNGREKINAIIDAMAAEYNKTCELGEKISAEDTADVKERLQEGIDYGFGIYETESQNYIESRDSLEDDQ